MADDLREINKNIKELASGLKQQFDKLGSRVGTEISDIMTPEIESVKNAFTDVVGATTDSGKSLLKFFGAGLTDDAKSLIAAEDTADEVGEQTDLMRGAAMSKGMKVKDKNLAKMMKEQNKTAKEELKISKREARRKRGLFKISKKSWLIDLLGILIGVPLAIIAAGIGVALAFIVKPFIIMYKMFKATKILWLLGKIGKGLKFLLGGLFKLLFSPTMARLIGKIPKIGTFFMKLLGPLFRLATWGKQSGIGRMVGKVGGFFRWIGKAFGAIGKIFKFVKGLPFIGRLAMFAGRGFLAGFSKIFWPIQIIISLIDFVKGFMKTEGTILDKIQGGIKNIVVKFFEWPLQLLGKIWEWIQVKILGKDPEDIKEGAAAAKMIEMLGKGVDFIFKGWKLIFGGIWTVVEPIWNWMKESLANWDFEETKKALLEGFQKIINLPKLIKDKILAFFGWSEDISVTDQANIGKAETGAFDEHERRMRKGNEEANKNWLLNRSQKNSWQYKYGAKMYDAQMEANEIAKQIKDKEGQIIALPPPNDPGRGIPDVVDLPTALQGYLVPGH